MLLYKIADELDLGVVFTDEPDNPIMVCDYCLGCDAKGKLYIVVKLTNGKCMISGWDPSYSEIPYKKRDNVEWFVPPQFMLSTKEN